MPRPDRRQEEIRRLLALMGGSTAAFYEDACRLLVDEPRLITASHLVAHLAREIEGGVRDLLTALIPADRITALEALERDPGQRDPSWKAVVDEICTALGFAEEDEVRSLWKSMLWIDRVHRAGLLRARPMDQDFRSAWRDFEVLLLRIGREYEATYSVALRAVDWLKVIDNPSKKDLRRLREEVPHSDPAMRRFFEGAGAGWFTRLREAGYLSDPPPLQVGDDGIAAYTPWPAGRYLVRMANVRSLSDAVVDVALGLDTDNPEACECVAEAALILNADAAAQLAPRLATFLTQPLLWALPARVAKVVVALATAGKVEAALTVLEPLLPTDARGRGGRYLDSELIHRAFPQLGLPGIRLLADRLDDLHTDHRHGLDHSSIWRPAIGTDRHGDGRDLLVSALRDAAIAVAAADGSAGVVQVLDRYEPALFGRLILHVLTDVPDTDLVAERLTSRALFDNAEAFREYTLLLQHQFATLPTEIQQQVVRFIEAGPPRDGPPEAADRWRLRQLTRFGDALPADQQALHESLQERFGLPENDDFEFLEFVGPTAPADAAALASMSDDELLTMLATWTPDAHWRAPSREGLRLELEAAVQHDPARFAALSPGFRDLDPTYGRGLLAGLTRAVSPGRASTRPGGTAAGVGDTASTETYADAPSMIDWPPVLTFGQAVLVRPRLLAGRPPTGDGDRDPGWIWCRQQLADLLAQGLHNDHIPPNDADTVLALLAQLADDPEPDEEDESDGRDDPATTAINTVRGCAILALIQFALWQHRHSPEGEPARLSDPVRAILEAHLDPRIDPTAAIRAVYGQWFRVLILCDPEWARSKVEKIFDRPDGSRLGAVAWESYLRFNAPVQQTYDLLSRWYFHSITALSGQQAFSDPASTEPDSEANEIRHHLVRHLAILYGQGIITVGADSLIEAFVSHAPLELRAELIEGLGIGLHNTKSPVPAALDRLRQLWEWRLDILRTTPDADLAELVGFGWWFSSDQLGVDWTVAQLQALLEAGGTVTAEHMVAEQLAAYRSTRLDKVVACLALLINAATDRWFISGSLDSIRAILAEGIRGADPATRRRTREIINRLVARGHAAFADLLAE